VPANCGSRRGAPETIMFSAASRPISPRQPLRATGAGQQAELDLRQAQLRVARSHAEVAAQRQLQPAAQSVAGDRGHHRLG
jgi:hypothetical protein